MKAVTVMWAGHRRVRCWHLRIRRGMQGGAAARATHRAGTPVARAGAARRGEAPERMGRRRAKAAAAAAERPSEGAVRSRPAAGTLLFVAGPEATGTARATRGEHAIARKTWAGCEKGGGESGRRYTRRGRETHSGVADSKAHLRDRRMGVCCAAGAAGTYCRQAGNNTQNVSAACTRIARRPKRSTDGAARYSARRSSGQTSSRALTFRV